VKNYYELLELPPTASADEIKRAFRGQIAKYHPDKVQHLGKEFQAMAADRAAELTEAYRVLSDAGRRAEYDQARADDSGAGAPAGPSQPSADPPRAAAPPSEAATPAADAEASARPSQFSQERASRDAFVRRAVVGKVRLALETLLGAFEEPSVRGFDIVAVPRSRMFSRAKRPRLLGRFVPRVDREAVAETWMWAGRWKVPASEEVCVLLMGSSVAPAGELADAIGQARRQVQPGARIIVIPVDARDWRAHIPTDAPAAAKELLDLLRKGK
jgi:curved DNA-binding protein CbpA